jgi:hypothetical protein
MRDRYKSPAAQAVLPTLSWTLVCIVAMGVVFSVVAGL